MKPIIFLSEICSKSTTGSSNQGTQTQRWSSWLGASKRAEVQTLVRMSNTNQHLCTSGWRKPRVQVEEAWKVTERKLLMTRCLQHDALILKKHAILPPQWKGHLCQTLPITWLACMHCLVPLGRTSIQESTNSGGSGGGRGSGTNFTYVLLYILNWHYPWGWRDVSAVKSTCYSSRGPGFHSQHPEGDHSWLPCFQNRKIWA